MLSINPEYQCNVKRHVSKLLDNHKDCIYLAVTPINVRNVLGRKYCKRVTNDNNFTIELRDCFQWSAKWLIALRSVTTPPITRTTDPTRLNRAGLLNVKKGQKLHQITHKLPEPSGNRLDNVK